MGEYALDKVIHYGAFKENLDIIVDIMLSESPGSVVIRGNSGTGKLTLVQEAVKKTNVKCVVMSPEYCIDDYAAMKAIASQLGFSARGAHIADLMKEIKENARASEKLVIVLLNFEDFCKQRQSLLYNLMNLIHTDNTQANNGPKDTLKGPNLTLIGLTTSLDWAENIEKRVRSRLNAKCINITLPYRNVKELKEFVSELLGGYKIDEDLAEHLEYIFNLLENPSIRHLKRFLSDMVTLDKRGKVVLEFDPGAWKDNYQMNRNVLLRERLRYLTRSQLDLMKLAIYHCYIHGTARFTLGELGETANRKNYRTYQPGSSLTLCDADYLLKLKLIKPAKHDQPISVDCVFNPAVSTTQFRAIMSGTPELQSTQTDIFWKYIK